MPKYSQAGTKHPTPSDVPDMAGIYHIGQCAECHETFPAWANIEAQARYADPAGYERIKAEQESLGN